MIPFDIHEFDALTSTQDKLRDIIVNAHHAANQKTIAVHALSQNSGRGRHGRKWESPAGNLYLSFSLRPRTPVQNWGQAGFVISLCMADTLTQLGIEANNICLKWPNDVLIGGKKCAGILIEREGDLLLVGIGLNVAHSPLSTSTSIERCGLAKGTDIKHIRDLILENVYRVFMNWEENGFDCIRRDWLALAHKEGTELKVMRMGNDVLEGSFAGLNKDGHLLLRDKTNTTHTIHSGDVFFRT